jgi:peroxiredoxin
MQFRTLLLAGAAALILLLAGNAVAKDFAFKDTQGQMQRLSDYRGKWVLVNFWATWCPPCMVEVPDLIALHNAHKDKDLVVIGVSLDSTRAAVKKFVAKHGITYPVVVGDYKLAAQVGEVEALPTSYLYDPNGKVVVAHTGIVTQASLEEYIRSRSAK